jgi:hypothetical protein
MHHRVVPGRIWLWLIVMLLSLHAIGSLAWMTAILVPLAFEGADYYPGVWMAVAGKWMEPFVLFPYWDVWSHANGGGPEFAFRGITQVPLLVPVGLGVWFVLAVVFALLTDTRRIHKVRLAHTARVCAYGLAWIVPIAAVYGVHRVLSAAQFVWALYNRNTGGGFLRFRPSGAFGRTAQWIESASHALQPVMLMGVLAWIGWWWWVALDKGLEIERSGRIWFVLMVPAALAAVVIGLLIYIARISATAAGWW